MKFRKKPVIVEAIQWTVTNKQEVTEFLNKSTNNWWFTPYSTIIIQTLEGDMRVSTLDWIIKGIKGEFYPCKPDIFQETYERVGGDLSG